MSEPVPLFGIDAPQETVYVMTDTRYFKLGFTARPVRRRGGELRAFELLSIRGDRAEEARLHQRFKRYRIGDSEWFRPEGDLLLWVIARVCQEGSPKACALLWETIRNHYGPSGHVIAA